jgi:hypothetical protein
MTIVTNARTVLLLNDCLECLERRHDFATLELCGAIEYKEKSDDERSGNAGVIRIVHFGAPRRVPRRSRSARERRAEAWGCF